MVCLILHFQVSQSIFEQSPGKNIEKGLIIRPFNLNLWLRDHSQMRKNSRNQKEILLNLLLRDSLTDEEE